jgi:NAD(P)-dependent dehydrogenase (short-subunit alcohol dehydrogenase family)
MDGRIAIVTGGSDGIGRATARLLAGRGAHVVIVARGQDKLDETAALIRDAGGSAEPIALDVADEAAWDGTIHDVAARHGRLDMLVNNAMAVSYAPIVDATLADWRRDFAVNAEAVFVGTRAAMRIMMPAARGAIVNVASTTAIRAAPNMASYSASKAALIQFSAVAAMEAARSGVRVNVVVPDAVATAATAAFERMNPAAAVATREAIPAGRSGEPHELAEAIAFLLSYAASYINGVALPVDGGKAAQLYLPG